MTRIKGYWDDIFTCYTFPITGLLQNRCIDIIKVVCVLPHDHDFCSSSISFKCQFRCVTLCNLTQHYHWDTCPGPAGLPSLWPCPPSGRRQLPVLVAPDPCLCSAGCTSYRLLSLVLPCLCHLPCIDTHFYLILNWSTNRSTFHLESWLTICLHWSFHSKQSGLYGLSPIFLVFILLILQQCPSCNITNPSILSDSQ